MNPSSRRDFIRRSALATTGFSCTAGDRWLRTAWGAEIGRDAVSRFRARLKGALILPDEDSFEVAKRVFYWNPRTERHPVAVVRCGHEDDVMRAVEFAREHSLETAVRSGGHSHLAWGSSNGIVIDLSPLRQITIDPVRRVVRAEGGALGGEIAQVAGQHGLVPVLGQCPGVGATGVTLGGGLGWLSGLFGACCDQLVSARLVKADATVVDVNEQTDADLFWAMRGAGANFGVTTSFEAKLQSMGPVLGGDIHFAVRDARMVLRGFRDIMAECPDGFQATLNLTSGDRGLFISFCHSGSETEANNLLHKIRSIAAPMKEAVSRQPYAVLAQKAAATNPSTSMAPAFRAVQTVYRDCISDDVIDIYVDQLSRAKPDVVFGLSHYMHGEVCRIKPHATAFPHRQAHAIHLRAAFNWSDPAETEERFAWGETWLNQLRPKSDERLYANYQTYDTTAGARSLFGLNYDRLLVIKAKHDPTNFFRRNANIAPAV